MNYHVVTLGCQMNLSDSERLCAVLNNAGFKQVENEDEANVIGIIACSVRQKAIDKVYSKIHKWNKLKKSKNLITFVTGCVLDEDKKKFLKLFDLIFQMSELVHLPEMIQNYGVVTSVRHNPGMAHKENPGYMSKFWDITPEYLSDFEAFIPIQNGCDKFCTYCAVPYTRGREISRPSDEILTEFTLLVNAGYKSITLLGQNVNSYGNDKNGDEITFTQLLEKIGEYGLNSGKKFWVYFTSPHPKDMSDDVIDTIARYPHLANQIHLPLQSGDDQMLNRMNRKHTLETYRKIIQKINTTIPNATIFTDIIVGFTGESDVEFQSTMDAFSEFKFNMAYIAKYSPRPGARSAEWEDDISNEIKTERLHKLTEELIRHSYTFNKNLVGTIQNVLVTGFDRKKKFLTGYTEGKIVTRILSNDEQWIGKFVPLKISGASELSIEGEIQFSEDGA